MDEISKKNTVFWNEMCGSTLAKKLGVKNFSSQELKKFDDDYFKVYCYLLKYFPENDLINSKVAEFGLGYGSLSQFLAANSKTYTGVDIAEGPVSIVNDRISHHNLESKASAIQGSALNMPFEDGSLDLLVSIGCFHHTGNFSKCVDETYRVLRPGGKAVLMVYNKYSYRRWLGWPIKTMASLLKVNNFEVTSDERAEYDLDTSGNSAPETQFYSILEIKNISKKFKDVKVQKENWSAKYPSIRIKTIPTLGNFCGSDLYIKLEK